MKRLCIYCGSSPGVNPAYAESARALGSLLVAQGIELIYGGGNVGLMGIVADTVMRGGGKVTGVIPKSLVDLEVAHFEVSELKVVGSMHERKMAMAELADGFVALPGGIGTMEELFEIWTWGQLGFHQKPCGLLNVNGYYDPLLAFLEHMTREQFLKPQHREFLLVEKDPEKLLERMRHFHAHVTGKGLGREEL